MNTIGLLLQYFGFLILLDACNVGRSTVVQKKRALGSIMYNNLVYVCKHGTGQVREDLLHQNGT